MTLDHDRCSELLRAHVLGTLAEGEEREVRNHLATCEACREEALAVRALEPPQSPRLSEIERRRLHVALGLAKKRGAGPSAWLGAVATVALLAVAAALWLPQQGGGDESAGGADSSLEQSEPQPEALEDAEGGADRAGSGGEAAASAGLQAAPPPRPRFFTETLDVTAAQLRRWGNRSPFTEFSVHYSAADAARLHSRFERRLAEQAPEELAGHISRCSDAVGRALPYPILPALAARGRVEDTEVFILGFAWTYSPNGPLDRFMLWGWEPDSCERPPAIYQTGIIRTR